MAGIQPGTKVRALKEAKGLLQTFGFNGFSFQHVADLLGIKKPSLYDHFKSKEEMGISLIEDYLTSFTAWAETVEVFEPKDKVGAWFEMFFKFSCDTTKLCPLSALVADYHTLPKKMKKPLFKLFDFEKAWLVQVIEEGQKKKVFTKEKNSIALAEMIVSMGLGSQLLARISEDSEMIRKIKTQALSVLEA